MLAGAVTEVLQSGSVGCSIPVTSRTLESAQMQHHKQRLPWWGGDLQTLRNHFVNRVQMLPGTAKALELPLNDASGDRMTGTLHNPDVVQIEDAPLIILLHGVAGSEDSTYMHESTRYFLKQGHPVLRLNMRGAGSSASGCSVTYHAGSGTDIVNALAVLPPDLAQRRVFLIGFSMGGSILIHALAALTAPNNVMGAATVSTPLNLARSSACLSRLRNRVYERSLLQDLIAQERRWRLGNAVPNGQDLQQLRSIRGFDDSVTAPRHGFSGAADYYDRMSCRNVIDQVETPLLLIHAMDDPWICNKDYVALQQARSAPLHLALTRRGGHVGFHFRTFDTPWHNHAIFEFLKRVSDA